MGWNSWDCYGASVTEDEVKGNAEYMARYLLKYGWEYVVVDIQWYESTADSSQYHAFVPLEMDEYSRLIPSVNRFPSSSGGRGFAPLAEYVHNLGLKFGIHIMRGIPRQAVHANTPIFKSDVRARDIAHTNSICPWNTDMYGVDSSREGAQAYYDSLFALYAEWGVDFVKIDDIAASRLYGIHTDEIQMIRSALDQCGRPMALSLSPGPAPLEHADLLRKNANMWRMTDDFWDHWDLLKAMFERCEQWAPHSSPGHWPDADMLPLGHIGIRSVDGGGADRWTRFTKNEQLTMMTLWCMFRSPLFFGGELRDNDDWTLSLLTNDEVLAVHRYSFGKRQVYRNGEECCWATHGDNGEVYVALFNLGETDRDISVTLQELGLTAPRYLVELWEGQELGIIQCSIRYSVVAHGAALLKLVRCVPETVNMANGSSD